MSRRPLIAGNWKLHLGPRQASVLATGLRAQLADVEQVDLAVFPTALSIPAVIQLLSHGNIEVGVQWATSHASGAYTGTNSPEIARELGCSWLLAGHSEVRRDLAETDERVNASIKGALSHGLLPMMCLGETLEQRQADEVEQVLTVQLERGLAGLHPDQVATVTLAYEPIWAIGTGETASPEQAQEVHAFIRGWLRQRYPAFVAEQTRILYGGSVKPKNAGELLGQPDIDGALVGGASLEAESFAAIVAAAR